jgi:hypothetical protein
MKYILTLSILLLTLLSYGQPTQPVEYYNQLQAAEDKYHVLKNLPGNDVVLDPISLVPEIQMYGETYNNYAKDLYNFPKIIPKQKVFLFIIDTEGEITHTDLQEGLRKEYCKSFTGESELGNVQGHGIHCLGIVVSKQEGVLYEYARDGYLNFAVVKALRNNGTGSFDQIYQAGLYVASMATRLRAEGFGEIIANFSLGANGTSALMEDMTTRMAAAGVTVIAAAGNTGQVGVGTPANTKNAYAVISIFRDYKKSTFSTYGPGSYISSFGQSIRSTDINNTYTVKSGTSMATPNQCAAYAYNAMRGASGTAKIIDPTLTRDLGAKGYDIEYGNGVSEFVVVPPVPVPPVPPVNPPSPPNDTISTYTIPITGKYNMRWGSSIFTGEMLTITSIQVKLKSKLASKEAIGKLIKDTKVFFTNRGIVLRSGDDFDEAIASTWLFYNMFMNRDGNAITISSITAETPEGYPLAIFSPLTTSLDSLEHGLIIYNIKSN